jgi:hypothetical protein
MRLLAVLLCVLSSLLRLDLLLLLLLLLLLQ